MSARPTTTEDMLRCWVDDTTLPQPLRNLLAHAADESRRTTALLLACRPFVEGDYSAWPRPEDVYAARRDVLANIDAVLGVRL